ncbi:MAG: SurA N-terminal domain-containing protein [Candidatus Omnitrophica bacterium]|nr:SurA N-terminal domain-containing protein [Candidatus Omnitrophota bacterium]
MLDILRGKNVKKLVLIGILILILPAFVLWGTGNLGGSKTKGPSSVGLIDGKKVGFDDFADSLRAARCQIIMGYYDQPKLLDSLLNSKEFLGKFAWDRLLMANEAKKAGIRITDGDVVRYIRNHPMFMRNGSFDERFYIYVLRNNMGLEPRAFEEIARQNIAIQQLNDSLTVSIAVNDEEVTKAYKTANEKFDQKKFEEERGDFAKKTLEAKKAGHLENWLRSLEKANKANIDFKDYEKYYR